MITLDIYLRGGQTITLDVTDWNVQKSTRTGDLLELTIQHADNNKLPYIRLDDVSAIVRRKT